MSKSLFDKYGGFETFGSVVSNFYQKVLDNDQLKPYFQNIKMERLMSHQTNFISRALGGPDRYEGRDLINAHANLNITHAHFIEVAELLEESLEEASVEAEDIKTIISVITDLRDQIVNS